jgi:uncharacterized SAM-binding protein YcdF (DUF218 family)
VVGGNVSVYEGSEAGDHFNPAISGVIDGINGIPGIEEVMDGPLGVQDGLEHADRGMAESLKFTIHNVTFGTLRRGDFIALESIVKAIVQHAIEPLAYESLEIYYLEEDLGEYVQQVNPEAADVSGFSDTTWKIHFSMKFSPDEEQQAADKLCQRESIPASVAQGIAVSPEYRQSIVGLVSVVWERPSCTYSAGGGVCLFGFESGEVRRCHPVPAKEVLPWILWVLLVVWLTAVTLYLMRVLGLGEHILRRLGGKGSYLELSPDSAPSSKCVYDAIIVPGGGSNGSGQPPPWVTERLKGAKRLWEQSRRDPTPSNTPSGEPWIILQSAGNPGLVGRPGETQQGTVSMEAQVNGRWLETNGVPREAMHRDDLSFNTLGNAFHARTRYTDTNQLRRVVVVTNRFHKPRAEAIYRRIFELPPLPRSMRGGYEITFLEVPDTGIQQSKLHARMQHEEQARVWFEGMRHQFESMDDVSRYLTASAGQSGARMTGQAPEEAAGVPAE